MILEPDQVPPPERDRHTPPRVSLSVWWFLAALLLLANDVRLLDRHVRIFPAPHTSLLSADSQWRVPISLVAGADDWGVWPGWLYAVGAGLAIAFASKRVTAGLPEWTTALALGIWTLYPASGESLILLTLLLLTDLWSPSPGSEPTARHWISPTVAIVVAPWVTLDFGLVWIFAAGRIAASPGRHSRRWCGAALAGLAAFGVASPWISPQTEAFFRAAIRPLSCLRSVPADLLPSLQPVALTRPELWQAGCLAILMACWIRCRKAPVPRVSSLIQLTLFSIWGLLCQRYLWIGSIAATLVVQGPATSKSSLRTTRLAIGLLCLVVALQSIRHADALRGFVTSSGLPANRLDPLQWSTRGPVLFFNLDTAGRWKNSPRGSRFPPVLDDRWDEFGSRYTQYENVLDDLRNGRSERYLHADGTWGGYQQQLSAWRPALLVAGSHETTLIRRLSLSPDFRILGVDAESVYFGRADEPANAPQAQRAMRVLATLEWPRPGQSTLDTAVIVAPTPPERCRVAMTLIAMRLPYAALRLVAGDESDSAQRIRAYSYLELAHRAHRYAGGASLLDQFRTVQEFNRLRASGILTNDDILRVNRGLESLGLPPLADQSTGRSADTTDPATVGESAVRAAIANGRKSEALALIPALSDRPAQYYAALARSDEFSPSQTYAALAEIGSRKELPGNLQAECWFYAGSLAIQLGDGRGARNAMLRSREAAIDSPYEPLRRLALQGL